MQQIARMADGQIKTAVDVESEIAARPQVPIKTQHVIHAGVYTRTIFLPAGTLIAGALVKRSTNLILSGKVLVAVGTETVEYEGHAVIAASAGRKQIFFAKKNTHISMYFATECVRVEDAEREFTDEYDLLVSHKDASLNEILITGE